MPVFSARDQFEKHSPEVKEGSIEGGQGDGAAKICRDQVGFGVGSSMRDVGLMLGVICAEGKIGDGALV